MTGCKPAVADCQESRYLRAILTPSHFPASGMTFGNETAHAPRNGMSYDSGCMCIILFPLKIHGLINFYSVYIPIRYETRYAFYCSY